MAETVTEEIRVRKGAIHCEGCEATIERNLSGIPGVQVVKASEADQVVRISWDPSEVAAADLKAKLADLGYPVEE